MINTLESVVGQTWADPDTTTAVRLLRCAFENPEFARAKASHAMEFALREFSTEAFSNWLSERILEIMTSFLIGPQ